MRYIYIFICCLFVHVVDLLCDTFAFILVIFVCFAVSEVSSIICIIVTLVIIHCFFYTEVNITRHLEEKVCSESQNVMFRVEVSHSGIDAVWSLKNQPLKAGPKYKMESDGNMYTLTIINTMKDNEGQYTFHAGEKTSNASLSVSGMFLLH